MGSGPRSTSGEDSWGSLNSDGSSAPISDSYKVLLDKLNVYNHDSHLSGQFDVEGEPWVEKFVSGNDELYIFFKPFKASTERQLSFDNETVNYTLTLLQTPTSVTLTTIDGTVTTLTPSQTFILEAENEPKYLEVNFE